MAAVAFSDALKEFKKNICFSAGRLSSSLHVLKFHSFTDENLHFSIITYSFLSCSLLILNKSHSCAVLHELSLLPYAA